MNKIRAHPLQVPSSGDAGGTLTERAAKQSGVDCSPGAPGAMGTLRRPPAKGSCKLGHEGSIGVQSVEKGVKVVSVGQEQSFQEEGTICAGPSLLRWPYPPYFLTTF